MLPDPLQEAIELISRKQYERARIILEQSLERDDRDEHAWLWLSACVESVPRQRYCLQRALLINPDNPLARQRLTELRSRVSEPTLDDVLGADEERIEPSTESARWARQLLAVSSAGAAPRTNLPCGKPAAGSAQAARCPYCHAGHMLETQVKHSSAISRTLAYALLASIALMILLIAGYALFALTRGSLLMLNDWFYQTPWQPLLLFLVITLLAFAFFHWYLNRSEKVMQCSHCGQRLNNKKRLS